MLEYEIYETEREEAFEKHIIISPDKSKFGVTPKKVTFGKQLDYNESSI